VFSGHRLAVFCDGDFWHGRDLQHRIKKLARGHNADYWIAKVQRNVERDRQNTSALSAAGWNVLRFWETEVLRETTKIADQIEKLLATTRSHPHLRAERSASMESGGR
jgi:DNA mismatch endonuclease (patch repair protein)